MKKKIKEKLHISDILILIVLIIYALSLILILCWGMLTSLKANTDYIRGNVLGLPDLSIPGIDLPNGTHFLSGNEALALGYYKGIISLFKIDSIRMDYFSAIFGHIEGPKPTTFTFVNFMVNSFVYSIICSFVHAFVAFTCAYLCAKYRFRFSEFIYVVMLVVMAIPIVGSSPSMITLLRDLAIYDTYFAMVALNFNFTGMYFFVFHAHLSGLSDTYVEAAEIDGASQLGILFRIIFPLCAKVFFTVFLLQFIQTWNDYQTPLLYYPNHPTMSYAIYKMSTQSNGGMDILSVPSKIAGCMVLAVPVFALFVAFNKTLMGNLTMGGLKE
ncbi:MAG: carbohydrate ABC transporter permease [Clostridia bacterium]|nr:carbohydrate ABC transporter permease [Clostridia bacterium]